MSLLEELAAENDSAGRNLSDARANLDSLERKFKRDVRVAEWEVGTAEREFERTSLALRRYLGIDQ